MVKRIEHITEDGVEKRWCGSCKIYLSIENFGKSSSTWDGLRPTCKECLHEQVVTNKEKITEYNKIYWQRTMDKQKEKSKQWREENKEKVKENMKKWLENNREYKAQKDREYRETHKEQYNENMKKWRTEQYQKMKEENGPEFIKYKLKTNISRRIREILGQQKSERCMDYVGCSLDQLKMHIESTFSDGMSWDNYGEWHIDHIIPCAAFGIDEMKACWYYKNLQALWAKDNIIKKDNYKEEDKINYLTSFFVNTF